MSSTTCFVDIKLNLYKPFTFNLDLFNYWNRKALFHLWPSNCMTAWMCTTNKTLFYIYNSFNTLLQSALFFIQWLIDKGTQQWFELIFCWFNWWPYNYLQLGLYPTFRLESLHLLKVKVWLIIFPFDNLYLRCSVVYASAQADQSTFSHQ